MPGCGGGKTVAQNAGGWGGSLIPLQEGKTRYLSEFEKSRHQEIRIQVKTRKVNAESSHADARGRAVADYSPHLNFKEKQI